MKSLILPLIVGLAISGSAQAQSTNPYAVAIRINDRVVTNYELSQRKLLMKAFGSGGDLTALATKQLIDDRLRLQAAAELGITVNEEDLLAGIAEFAARGKLTGEQLLQYIQSRGADPDSMRTFVEAGLLWREVVGARFGAKARISDDELDTTLNLATAKVQQSVLISEIQLPLRESGNEATLELIKKLSQTIKTQAAFTSAARRYSRAPSRARGGRLDWVPVGGLPPALAGQLLSLEPGEVTAPVTLSKTVGIFQLRAIRQDKSKEPALPISISYTQVPIPTAKGRAQELAASLISDVDTCADLRAESERFGENAYSDNTVLETELPAEIALSVANLDRYEASYVVTGPNAVSVVMVCDRLRDLPEGTRDSLRNALFNRRLTGFGDGYLQELQADAEIIYK
jgi:peptidyl-prolyl cis-trans isomerase SurA